MTVRERMAGTAFKIFFEMLCLGQRLKGDIEFQFPGAGFRSVGAFPGAVFRNALFEVGGMPDVSNAGKRFAFEDVGVEHGERYLFGVGVFAA